MFTIQTLNAISPVGLAKLNKNLFEVAVETDAPDGILVRSADLLNAEFKDNLLAIARAGAGVNNIPLDRCSEQGIVVFNTPGANANAVAELVVGMLIAGSRNEFADQCTRFVVLAFAEQFFGFSKTYLASVGIKLRPDFEGLLGGLGIGGLFSDIERTAGGRSTTPFLRGCQK